MSTEAAPRTPIKEPPVHGDGWREQLVQVRTASPVAAFGLAPGDSVLVVGAHPDDESLALGATLADLTTYGVTVHVISLTVGDAALDAPGISLHDLPDRRREEFKAATDLLGAASATVFDFPESRLREFQADAQHIVRAAVALHAPNQVFTVWRDDPHPDHQVAGRVAVRAAAEAALPCREFSVWARRWPDPDRPVPDCDRLLRLDTSPMALVTKMRALASYGSQTEHFTVAAEPGLSYSAMARDDEILVRP